MVVYYIPGCTLTPLDFHRCIFSWLHASHLCPTKVLPWGVALRCTGTCTPTGEMLSTDQGPIYLHSLGLPGWPPHSRAWYLSAQPDPHQAGRPEAHPDWTTGSLGLAHPSTVLQFLLPHPHTPTLDPSPAQEVQCICACSNPCL